MWTTRRNDCLRLDKFQSPVYMGIGMDYSSTSDNKISVMKKNHQLELNIGVKKSVLSATQFLANKIIE